MLFLYSGLEYLILRFLELSLEYAILAPSLLFGVEIRDSKDLFLDLLKSLEFLSS